MPYHKLSLKVAEDTQIAINRKFEEFCQKVDISPEGLGFIVGAVYGGRYGRAIKIVYRLARRQNARLWFLGRDMYNIYKVLFEAGYNVGYLTGFNRGNSKEMQESGIITDVMREAGVKPGDYFLDTGFNGSIFDAMIEYHPHTWEDGEEIPEYRNEFWQKDHFYLIRRSYTGEERGYLQLHSYRETYDMPDIVKFEHCPKNEVYFWDNNNQYPGSIWLNDASVNEFNTGFKRGWRAGRHLTDDEYILLSRLNEKLPDFESSSDMSWEIRGFTYLLSNKQNEED